MKRTFSKHQAGYLTLITVVLVVIVGFISAALVYITFGRAFGALNAEDSMSAFYIAESGIEDGIHELEAFTLTDRSTCSGLNLTTSSPGVGVYTVTATGPFSPSTPTTLNGALTASATSITVASTANYQSSGRITIDNESIDYAAIDATHFLSVQRGTAGTTAAAHVTGTSVGQYQCNLLSTGGAPKLTYNSGEPGGKRILEDMVQLQDGWAVGNASSGNISLMRWNKPTEIIWNNAPIAGTTAIRGVSMDSYVDGWAVGTSTTFLHWNGVSWSSVASGLANVNFNGVFCLAKNNCHVVGDMTSSSAPVPTIADWNGTTWTNTTLNVGGKSGHQEAIYCAAANDCWSVGNIGATRNASFFYHWNGTTWSSSLLTGMAAGDFPYNGVACASTSDCWAVGSSSNFEHWNGSTWTLTASGMPSATYNGIYCNSTSDCWAVGNVNNSNDLIVHWNGSAWSRDTSNPKPNTNLNSVTCINADDCWAVGAAANAEPSFVHWDGTSWTTFVTSGLPNVAANSISLLGAEKQPNDAWAQQFP